MDNILEKISHNGVLLGIVVPIDSFGNGVNFFTDANSSLQLGILNHMKGTKITPHYHNKIKRTIEDTNEALIILKGSLIVHFYIGNECVCERKCLQGQILLLLDGGHGFEIEEDSCIVEAKVGPYLDERDKVRL